MPVIRLILEGQLSITPDCQVQSLEPHQSGRISEPRISEDFIRDQLPWGSAVVPRCLHQADRLLSDLKAVDSRIQP